MKKSIIYLGIAVLTITNVISALAQQSFIKGDSLAQTVSSNTSFVRNTQDNPSTEKRNTTNGETFTAVIDPETIMAITYQKTMEEIIAENNQIIESSFLTELDSETNVSDDNQINISIEGNTFNNETSLEELIQQDSQIIESPVLNAIQLPAPGKSKKS